MRVTLNIWSLLCPFPPLFISPSLVSPSLPFPLRKDSVKLCQTKIVAWQAGGKKGYCQSCFSLSSDKLMSTQPVRRAAAAWPLGWRQNANPAEMSATGNPGPGIVLISSSFVPHVDTDICSSFLYQGPYCHWDLKNRSASIYLPPHRWTGHQCADND